MIVWTLDGDLVEVPTPLSSKQIDYYMRIVYNALDRKTPFWYGQVKNYNKLHIRVQNADGLWDKKIIPLYPDGGGFNFDKTAYRNMKRNYNVLHKALVELYKHNIIHLYTLRSNGHLRIKWMIDFERTPKIVEFTPVAEIIRNAPKLPTQDKFDFEYRLRHKKQNYGVLSYEVIKDNIIPFGKVKPVIEKVLKVSHEGYDSQKLNDVEQERKRRKY